MSQQDNTADQTQDQTPSQAKEIVSPDEAANVRGGGLMGKRKLAGGVQPISGRFWPED